MSIELSGSTGDRFIPNRSAMNLALSQYNLSKENQDELSQVSGSLSESLFSTPSVEACKILACKAKAPEPRQGYENRLGVLYSQNLGQTTARATRSIPTKPERVLDAPDMLDDYYLNILDWSKDNRLAVALGSAVYIWSAETSEIIQLCDHSSNITSLSWASGGQHLAVGTEDNKVQLWDASAVRQLRTMEGHSARVSSLSWNGTSLSSAGRDSLIMNHDVRISQHLVSTFSGHTQEVCGLTWSPDGTQLASGGNDNLMFVWDGAAQRARYRITEHGAAVKALAWCPFAANTLASGSGTADPSIRFWNTASGALVNKIDTGAQVCSLQWSRHFKEIVSSHGWSNNIRVWRYPSMTQVASLEGHTSRVLHLAQSPDGTTLASAAADETIRFWNIWNPASSASLKVGSGLAKSQVAPRSSALSLIR